MNPATPSHAHTGNPNGSGGHEGRKAHSGGLLILAPLLIISLYMFFSLATKVEPSGTTPHYQVTTGFNHTLEGAFDFVNLCLVRSSTYNVILFGRRGGVLELTAPYLPTAKTSLLADGDRGETLTVAQAQEDLAAAINAGMDACISDFGPFTHRGYAISIEEEASTRVTITADTVNVAYTHPFTITHNKLSKTYQRFSLSIPSRMRDMIELTHAMISFAKNRPEDADLTPLLDKNIETLFFSMDNATIAVMRDLDHPLDGAPYEFWVGMR